jgi:hypothetical protein
MRNFWVAAVAAGLALAGCSSYSEEQVNPSGKYPDARTGNAKENGTLNIMNADWPGPRIGGEGRNVPMPTPLASIYDQDGNFITNTRSTQTSLAPGRYLVRLEDEEGQNSSPFWVTIEPGKATDIDARTVKSPEGKQPEAR